MTLEAIHSGIDLSYVDDAARPQDDLFGHVNGRWLDDYDIPADRATDGAFRLLADRAEEQVRDLIIEPPAAARRRGTDQQRIGDLYASFMDTDAVARLGLQPLLDELAADRRRRPTASALAAVLGELQRTGVGGGTGRLRRHRLQELHPLPAAPVPVRPRPARRVVLPRPAARRDPRRLPRAHRRACSRWCSARSTPEMARRRAAPHRRAGDQARRRALGRGQAPRRRPDLQPAHVHRPDRRGARVRLGGLGHRAGHLAARPSPRSWCASPTS